MIVNWNLIRLQRMIERLAAELNVHTDTLDWLPLNNNPSIIKSRYELLLKEYARLTEIKELKELYKS